MSIRKGSNIIASGGLTDYSLVHKTGDEIIQGHKTFTQEVYLRNPYMDIETPPSSTSIDNPIRFEDKNGNVTSTLVFRQETTNSIASRLYVRDHLEDTWACIGIGFTNSNQVFTIAPYPVASSSDQGTDIATTGWVNNPNYSANVVHRTGNETIGGIKVFNDDVVANAGVRMEGITTTSGVEGLRDVVGIDTNNARVGGLRFIHQTDNSRRVTLYICKTDNTNVGGLSIGLRDDDTTVFTSAPTPPTDDNSTQIATTAWVNSKIVAGTGGFPNYSAAAGRAQNTSYTAGTNGFLYIHIVRSNSSEGSIPITISGYTFTLRSNDYGHVNIMYPIAKGTTYSIGSQTNLSTVELTWFPAI